MKKNKKNTKKARYNGRNAFGQRCIAKFVVLEKETAMQQFLEALADIDAHEGQRIEYTFVGFLPIIGQLLAKLFFLLAQPLCEFSVSAPFSHEPCAWVNSIVP